MRFFPIHLTINQVVDLYEVLAKQKKLPETLEDVKCQLLDIGYPLDKNGKKGGKQNEGGVGG